MAATKLTLRLDEDLVASAKAYARSSGKSVSQLVAGYFSALRQLGEKDSGQRLSPLVGSLKGAWKGSNVEVEDYHRHLAEKHR